MASAKRSISVPALLFLNLGGLVVFGIAYRLYGRKYIKDRQYERAEAYASSLYEKLKEEKGNVGMES